MSYTWVRATTDQVICTAPGYIGSVIVTPDGKDDTAKVTIYDGESANDPQITSIRTGAGVTRVVRFQPPLKTQRGLYITLDEKVEEVLIQHSWGKE